MVNLKVLNDLKKRTANAVSGAIRISTDLTQHQKEQWKVSVTCFLEQALTNIKEIERKAIAKAT